MDNKYIITLEFDHFNKDDLEAVQAALRIAKNFRYKYDNDCKVYRVHKQMSALNYVQIYPEVNKPVKKIEKVNGIPPNPLLNYINDMTKP